MAISDRDVQASPEEAPGPEIELAPLAEVPLQVTVRLGSARLTLGELLQLQQGSVVLLDRQVGEPAEIMVGDRVVALGEMVRVGDELGVRVTRVSPAGPRG
jgi:flagellar motor switch protein FliN/FliY